MKGLSCNIIVPNVYAPSAEKSDDSKDKFYGELEQVFNHFPKYQTKILLGNFNLKLEREDIFKPTILNDGLHRINPCPANVENMVSS
jgi:exonuclease III